MVAYPQAEEGISSLPELMIVVKAPAFGREGPPSWTEADLSFCKFFNLHDYHRLQFHF